MSDCFRSHSLLSLKFVRIYYWFFSWHFFHINSPLLSPSRLTIPNLGITEKYSQILSRFGREIENTSRNYQRHKNDPPVARDLPPISGKITWARQMFQRIQEPMEVFQAMPHLLQGAEAKRIIKNYNKLAKVLMEFEVLYHRAWLRQVSPFSCLFGCFVVTFYHQYLNFKSWMWL